MSRLPNFFIVGAPKAGTTSLYHYLDQHPQVYMSAIKEPHFFSEEIREESFAPDSRATVRRENREANAFLAGPMLEKRFGGIVSDWGSYRRLFAQADKEIAIGEASVCYLWSPSAARRIAEAIPDAKIVIVLRDPAERAFAQYLHGCSHGAIRWSFREHIERSLRYKSREFCSHYPFLEFGRYHAQILRYRECFGKNVWIGFHEDFESQPAGFFKEVCRFLGVDEEFVPDMSKRYLQAQVPRFALASWMKEAGYWRVASKMVLAPVRHVFRRLLTVEPGTFRMSVEDRKYLVDFYREDIENVALLLGRDLSHWLLA